MKKIKRVIAIIMCCMVVMIEGITSYASVALPALPALPYIPPTRAKIWDILNNIWGLTGLPISDDEKRAQAYEEMMLRYLTQAQVDELVKGVRERRKYEIKAGVRDGLSQYMLYQVQTGYDLVSQEAIEGAQSMSTADAQRIVDELAKVNVQQTVAELQQRYTQAKNSIGGNLSVCVWVTRLNNNYAIWQGFYKAQYNAKWESTVPYGYDVPGETYLFQSGGGIKYNNAYGTAGTYAGKLALKSTSAWDVHILHINFGRVSENKKPAVQNNAVSSALTQGTDYPITKDTTLVNGAYDTTQTTTIDYPATDIVHATNVNDLAAVQDKLGVVPSPITQDLTDTVAQLQAQSMAQYGDTGQYALDLRNYFPFCIPFDIANLLGSFVSDPQAPSFEWTFPIGIDKETGQFAYVTLTIDLSAWDTVAYWVRKGELALFIVGLAVVTRQWFLRG